MKYPTLKEVEQADHKQLAIWYRFLPSPGDVPVHHRNINYSDILKEQTSIMIRISDRFKEMGMFTSELSKEIGWDRRPYEDAK